MDKKLIILAGGNGTRFWPYSKKETPKQVLNISGKDYMINESYERLSKVFSEEEAFIATVRFQADCIKSVLNKGSKIKFINEPEPRGTAACILMSAIKLYRNYGDCIICAMPADSYIEDEESFNNAILKAVEAAAAGDKIITLGIKPSFPSTGYGYINALENTGGICKVKAFVEKPAKETAKNYYDSGHYYWNAGIFVFTAKQIINSFKKYSPEIYNAMLIWEKYINTAEEENKINEIYKILKPISIDYAIMEKADNIFVIPAEIGWHDLGSWDVIEHLYGKDKSGNAIKGECICVDTKNCSLIADKMFIAAVGLEDIIVVEKDGIILVCKKDKAQDVKKVVDQLKSCGKESYT